MRNILERYDRLVISNNLIALEYIHSNSASMYTHVDFSNYFPGNWVGKTSHYSRSSRLEENIPRPKVDFMVFCIVFIRRYCW